MELTFLGNWSAKTIPGKSNTSFLVDEKTAFDFGPGSLSAMIEAGIDPNSLEQVFISHLHYDHFSGLVGLLWHRAMSGNEEELLITGPKGIEGITTKLLECYATPSGFRIYASFSDSSEKGKVEIFEGIHTVTDYAYRYSNNGKVIFYSGDTAYSDVIANGAANSDLLIHEMTYPDELKIEADIWKHSTVSDVLSIFEESHSKRLVPVHLTADSMRVIPTLQNQIGELYTPDDKIIL